MPNLSHDGVSFYYELTSGHLPPVILLHGLGCDHTFLAPQMAYFSRLGHTVLSLDFRGHGRSDKLEQPYPIGGFADDVAAICEALRLGSPIVIGHSMGGIVAYDLAARWPDLPSAIIMLDAAVVLPEAARATVIPQAERLRASDYAAERVG